MVKIEQKKVKNVLSKYVRKISVFECRGSMDCKHRLIPSGSTYLSYNHKDIPKYFYKKRIKPSERLQVTGPKTNQDIYVEYGGLVLQVLVEFTPTGFYYLFHKSPASYLNMLVELSHFENHGTTERLCSILLATDSTDAQIEIIQDFLIDQSYHALPFSSYIEEAVSIIESSFGKILVKDIAKAVNKSERQLSRQFTKMVGISPKQYSKIRQLHYVINLMNTKEFSSFKEIYYSANFYDQSHFDHRFKELVGIKPNEFLLSKEHNALKYFTDLVKARDMLSSPKHHSRGAQEKS